MTLKSYNCVPSCTLIVLIHRRLDNDIQLSFIFVYVHGIVLKYERGDIYLSSNVDITE